MLAKIMVSTSAPRAVVNITARLQALVAEVRHGLAVCYLPHTSAALLLCEDDAELRADLLRTAERWLTACGPFAHRRNGNPNAEAHLLSAFGGTSLTLAVVDGLFDLGTYQQVLLLELDGPKEREVRCAAMSDARQG